jgi:hypothetical protein
MNIQIIGTAIDLKCVQIRRARTITMIIYTYSYNIYYSVGHTTNNLESHTIT